MLRRMSAHWGHCENDQKSLSLSDQTKHSVLSKCSFMQLLKSWGPHFQFSSGIQLPTAEYCYSV